ncbi:MAG: hypothetical protein EOP83_21235 [Verrucomicrobiaceae bacterium]|nr:MAG: hypothetical protein EOP83_21235 [Verrucomicrobiaceae bacterium]
MNPADYAPKLGGYWEVRHAPDTGVTNDDLSTFPIYANDVWKTGADPATAPIRWLNVGAGGGHAAAGHAMVLRWRATGTGQVKMAGHLKRSQKGGNTLAWRIDGKGKSLAEAAFSPESSVDIEGTWIDVKPGDTMDFVLRAPEGDSCGGVNWSLNIEGRESEAQPETEVGSFAKQFPTSNNPPGGVQPASPWADLVQMLWASNEFHFVD